MGNYWRFETNPFWHHEWREFNAEQFARIVGKLLGCAILAQISLASLFLLIKPNQFLVGSNLLIAAMIFHFITRFQIEKEASQPNFH